MSFSRSRRALAAAVIFAAAAGGDAFAQPVEQNPAPIIEGDRETYTPEPVPEGERDDTPLGVDLKRLVVVDRLAGEGEPTGVEGVDLSAAGPVLNDADFAADLRSFVGKPLSKKLISDIRIAIIERFRAAGRPLVAVNTPPQEISGGVLRFEALPFVVGDVRVEGADWTPEGHIRDGVRLKPGDAVAADQLIADLNWLNRNPYRNLGVVFEPGDKPGTANVLLRSEETEPYSFSAGFATSGSRDRDPYRLFVGANVVNLPFLDDQFGYQFTTSDQNLKDARLIDLDSRQGHLSHAVTYQSLFDYGDGVRHRARLQASYVESFSVLTPPFTQDNRTLQLYGEYAAPLNAERALGRDLSLEVYGALDYKRQKNELFFAGLPQFGSKIDIMQFALGLRGGVRTPVAAEEGEGGASFELRLNVSPGGLTGRNSDADFAAAAGDPDASATYGYLYGRVDHAAPLWGGFQLDTGLAFQLAERALPGLEQFAYGGQATVRGYRSNEASGDDGFAIQNTVRFPSMNVAGGDYEGRDALQPYLFADYGHSADRANKTKSRLLGAGAGLEYRFDGAISATLQYGHAFKTGIETQEGDANIYGALSIRF